MDLNTITVADFKALFRRDFPYLPTYDNSQLYNAGTTVYYSDTLLFYKCLYNGTQGVAPNDPTPPSKWEQIIDNVDNYVGDDDITCAFAEAQVTFNQALFGDNATITLAYLYLTAAYLVNDLRAAMGGIMSSGFFPLASRSVGNVSESFDIPQAYKDDPILSFLTQSAYGMKYLSLVLPNLRGNVKTVAGATLP